jgi:XTP/dITP diphosphohydrolase
MDLRKRVPLVVATRSAGKVRELGPLVEQHGWQVLSLNDVGLAVSAEEDAVEAFDTFEANALAKARYFATMTGRAVLADDSGLAVDALDGRPGVHSKRWSGSTLDGPALDAVNNQFLQTALHDAARRGRLERSARYVCAAACAWPGGSCVRTATTDGTLLEQPRGEGGFGYDPFFWSIDLQQTFAEASLDAKAEVSHRGRAFRALLAALEKLSVNFAVPVDPSVRSG